MDPDSASSPAADSASPAERRQIERRTEDRGKLERVSARGLIALLLAVAALAFVLFFTWRQYGAREQLAALQAEQQRMTTLTTQLQRQLAAADERLARIDRRTLELGNLGAQFEGLSESVNELRARADAAQLPWIMAEARYLLEIANRRLTLERDADSALAALVAADERLSAAADPGLNAARRKLASEIQSLSTVKQPDLAGVASRLAAAEELAADLAVKGAVAQNYEPPNPEGETAPGFGRAWRMIRRSLTGIVSVRRIGEDAVELVSIEEQGLRRQHLQLLLFAGRVAALRGDEEAFRSSIANARQWLTRMFDPADERVGALNRELASLAGLDIAPALPDISGSLRLIEAASNRSGPSERRHPRNPES
jgi:uroporphyrin-3 C-methyltransferase